jgi:hypothetical protein
MTRYSVSCFSPPSSLSIKKGDKVRVKGRGRANNILAESIENLTGKGPICRCGSPKYISGKDTYMQLKILPEWVEKMGVVKSVTVSDIGITFEMETP